MKKYIVGNVKSIIYESNSGPYKVGVFRVKESNDKELLKYVNKTISFTGNFNELNNEIDYIFYGKLSHHKKYGTQFSTESYEIKEPSDIDSIIIYLSSGFFKGVGTKTAQRIVEKFGIDTINVIKTDYEKLALISGMTLKKAKMMHDKITESELNQELIVKLGTYGFTVKEAIELLNLYGNSIFDVIENNIYELKEYISFVKLDNIFLKYNYEMHEYRVLALIEYLINNYCYETGDTLIRKEELFLRLKRCFNNNFTIDIFLLNIDKLKRNKKIIEINDCYLLYNYYDCEMFIMNMINNLNKIKNVYDKEKISKYIKDYEKKYSISFNESQKSAISASILNNFYIITGGPGTGKTTIIRAIVEILKNKLGVESRDIALLAPTGRSAKRMTEAVGAPGYTIHKFLKWNKELSAFGIDEFNKASEKIIIVDEASMIDIFLFSSLLKGLKSNVKIILVGDVNQLPSIGPGDLLNDLINLPTIKSKYLDTIYRVKEGSYITTLAKDIKEQKEFLSFPDYNDFKFIECRDEEIIPYLNEIVSKAIKKDIKVDNFQVLAPMYKGLNGIDNLNKNMSELFNKNEDKYLIGDKYYKINDKVIQLVNDVENNVFNGDIGYITDIRNVDNKIFIDIDYIGNNVTYTSTDSDKFNLAYAVSIHKSQGSEYDNVVVVLAKSFSRMFYNKLLYTAVTRAKKSLIILGSIDSFNKSVKTLYATDRNTLMKNV